MPNPSKHLYTLSEIAQIIGIEEKQVDLYAQKGLINKELLKDRAARFTQIDCARLKVIAIAFENGYNPDEIIDLIGDPHQVRCSEDSLSACEQFALSKYKQIYDEFINCKGLEQINKQCDIELIKTYIQHLKELSKDCTPKKGQQKSAPHSIATAEIKGDTAESRKTIQESTSKARVQRFPTDKLWEYLNAQEDNETTESRNPIIDKARQADKTVNNEQELQVSNEIPTISLRKPAKPRGQSYKTRYFRRPANKLQPVLKGFAAWAFIVMIAVAYFSIVQDDAKGPESLSAQTKPTKESGTDGYLPNLQPPAPTEPASASQPMTADVIFDTSKDLPETSASENELALHQEVETPANQQLIEFDDRTIDIVPQNKPNAGSNQDAVDNISQQSKLQASIDAGELKKVKKDPAVRVENLSLWHDRLNRAFHADLVIAKSNVADNEERVEGYVFVYLESEDGAADRKELLLPFAKIQSGKPAQIKQGKRFSIKRLKRLHLEAASQLSPTDLSSGQVWVYSAMGDLLLERTIDVRIQPFSSEDKISPAPLKTNSVPQETMIAAVSSAQGKSQIQPKTAIAEEKIQPIANIQNTNHPEAAIWDFKSHFAVSNGEYDQAISFATKAIQLDPGRVRPYISRSLAYREKNMLNKSIQDSKTALSINPNYAQAFYYLGMVYQLRDQISLAQKEYRRACELGLDSGCEKLNAIKHQ